MFFTYVCGKRSLTLSGIKPPPSSRTLKKYLIKVRAGKPRNPGFSPVPNSVLTGGVEMWSEAQKLAHAEGHCPWTGLSRLNHYYFTVQTGASAFFCVYFQLVTHVESLRRFSAFTTVNTSHLQQGFSVTVANKFNIYIYCISCRFIQKPLGPLKYLFVKLLQLIQHEKFI